MLWPHSLLSNVIQHLEGRNKDVLGTGLMLKCSWLNNFQPSKLLCILGLRTTNWKCWSFWILVSVSPVFHKHFTGIKLWYHFLQHTQSLLTRETCKTTDDTHFTCTAACDGYGIVNQTKDTSKMNTLQKSQAHE